MDRNLDRGQPDVKAHAPPTTAHQSVHSGANEPSQSLLGAFSEVEEHRGCVLQ